MPADAKEPDALDGRLAAMLLKALERLETEGDDSGSEHEYDAFELRYVARFIKEAAVGEWHHLAGVAEHVQRRADEISNESFASYERSLEPVPWRERPFLNATEVGGAFKPSLGAIAVKDLLAQVGFLERTASGWKPTEAALASKLAEQRQDSVGSTYVLWRPGIVDYLTEEIDRREDTDSPIILQWLSPSLIGRSFRQVRSAATVNDMLEQMGLQSRAADGGWEACGGGLPLSRAKVWFDSKKRPSSVEWKPPIVKVVADRYHLALTALLESGD